MFIPPFETQELARALADPTRYQVFSRIAAAAKPVTVKDLMETFDLHHSAIRIHLRKLQDAGLISSQTLHHQGSVGRPELAFTLGPRRVDISMPPRNPELLAALAMEFAQENGADAAGLRAFGEKWGSKWATDHFGQLDLPLFDALVRLKEALIAIGCNTEVGDKPDGHSYLVETNCLFLPLSREFLPLICELHQGIISGMLSALAAEEYTLEHRESIAQAGERCLTIVTPTVSVQEAPTPTAPSPTPRTDSE